MRVLKVCTFFIIFFLTLYCKTIKLYLKKYIILSGYDEEKSLLMSQRSLEKRFGQSSVFISATFMENGGIPPTTNPATLLKEAIHVISCGYEDKTEWGKEVILSSNLLKMTILPFHMI